MISYILYQPKKISASTIILIHGWCCDQHYWDKQIPALQGHYRIIAVDLAGHGASSKLPADGTIIGFAKDLVSLLQTIPVTQLPNNSPLVLIGHSMGGPIAIEAALMLGIRVRAVIGIDTLKNIGMPPMPQIDINRRVQLFQENFISETQIFVKNTFFKPDANPIFVERIAKQMSAGNPTLGIAMIHALNNWNGGAAISALKIPITTINSDHGYPTDETRTRQFSANFKSQVIAGSGHFLMMEKPRQFNLALLKELKLLSL